MHCLHMYRCVCACVCLFTFVQHIFVHVACTVSHLRLQDLTNQRNSWPGENPNPLHTPTTESCLLCISQRSEGGGVQITVGLHVQIQLIFPFKPPAAPPPPTTLHNSQDVLSVMVSTSPSGHIPDIWTAAGSPQVRQSEGASESK